MWGTQPLVAAKFGLMSQVQEAQLEVNCGRVQSMSGFRAPRGRTLGPSISFTVGQNKGLRSRLCRSAAVTLVPSPGRWCMRGNV